MCPCPSLLQLLILAKTLLQRADLYSTKSTFLALLFLIGLLMVETVVLCVDLGVVDSAFFVSFFAVLPFFLLLYSLSYDEGSDSLVSSFFAVFFAIHNLSI